ncbi:UTRA domain-containing protein [Actinomadura xylanilytica]|uniref:UTRA domain-containing protein n=1 Tax=Actinomadura xylanilytica TaxID=887459 RepID=UPI00255ABB86|nr:UTRA domain-containing protein [Actinomadura xylanilytica]MDL4773264.1 UTRA domain-containing protein [Actinomadura xylanilytica]
MRAIGHDVASATEIVTARAILASEGEQLGDALGSIVMVIRRTHMGARPLETADIIVPVDRFELAYAMPVG